VALQAVDVGSAGVRERPQGIVNPLGGEVVLVEGVEEAVGAGRGVEEALAGRERAAGARDGREVVGLPLQPCTDVVVAPEVALVYVADVLDVVPQRRGYPADMLKGAVVEVLGEGVEAGEFVDNDGSRVSVDAAALLRPVVRADTLQVRMNVVADEEVGRVLRVADGVPPLGIGTVAVLLTGERRAE